MLLSECTNQPFLQISPCVFDHSDAKQNLTKHSTRLHEMCSKGVSSMLPAGSISTRNEFKTAPYLLRSQRHQRHNNSMDFLLYTLHTRNERKDKLETFSSLLWLSQWYVNTAASILVDVHYFWTIYCCHELGYILFFAAATHLGLYCGGAHTSGWWSMDFSQISFNGFVDQICAH